LFAPPRSHDPLPVPACVQGTETAQPAEVEVRPRGAEGSVASEPDAPNPLSWAQQMDLVDAEMANLTSSRGDAVEHQGPVTAPPCPAPLPRPWLQPQDVVNAARPHWFAGATATQSIVPALLAEYSTVLSTEQLRSCLEWMVVQRRDITCYLRVWISNRVSTGSTPYQILQALLQFLESMQR